jgi:hypothetical protein
MPRCGPLAEEVVRVFELEREPEHGRDGRERDVALLPVEPEVELPVVAAEDDATGGDRAGVGAGLRLGERERGEVLAGGEAREVAVLLRLACRSGSGARPGRASSAPSP